MIFGVLSDTHKKKGRARRAIDMLVQNGAQYLIHAGDIGREETLAYMASTGLPYAAVLGNNDRSLKDLTGAYHLFREPHYFEVDGVRIKLAHHPYYLSPDADLIVYGHTHRFEAAGRKGALFLNPGEVCARNKPVSEAVLLRVSPDGWEAVRCRRRIKERDWHYETLRFPKTKASCDV